MHAILTIDGSSLYAIFRGAGSELQDKLVAEMSEILKGQGYVVEIPSRWETPKDLCSRLNITVKTFCRRMKLPLCPKPHDVIRNGKGIEHLRSYSILDGFLTSGPTRSKHQ